MKEAQDVQTTLLGRHPSLSAEEKLNHAVSLQECFEGNFLPDPPMEQAADQTKGDRETSSSAEDQGRAGCSVLGQWCGSRLVLVPMESWVQGEATVAGFSWPRTPAWG